MARSTGLVGGTRGRGRRRLGAAVVAGVLLAACSSGGDDATDPTDGGGDGDLPTCPLDALDAATSPVELTVWHAYTAKTAESLEALAARYNAEQDRVVVRIESQGTYEELWQKYLGAIPSEDLPGIAIPDDTVTRQIIDSGTVLPAQACIDASDADVSNLLPAARAYYTVDGVQWPGTLNVSAPLLYINRTHFERAGLDPDDTPGTLTEVREAAQAIKDAGIVEHPMVLSLTPAIMETLLAGASIPIVDNGNGRGDGETTEAVLDGEGVVDLLTWIRSMMDDGLLEVVPLIDGQVAHYLAMASQESSMTIETSTAATSVEAFLGGELDPEDVAGAPTDVTVDTGALDLDAGPIPGIEEAGQMQMGGGAWYITNTSADEVQAAAWDFITWFNEVPQQVTWSIEGSYLPFNTDAVDDPALQAAWSDKLSGRWLAIAWEEINSGLDPDFPGPIIGPYDQVRDALREAADQVVSGGVAPADALAEADSISDDAIEEYSFEF